MVHLESVFILKIESKYSFNFGLMAIFSNLIVIQNKRELATFSFQLQKRKIGKKFLVDFKCFL